MELGEARSLAAATCLNFPLSAVGDCSAKGTCNDSGKCVCEPGWTGLSDWVNAEGYDCQVSELALIILWSICFATNGLPVIFGIPRIAQSYFKAVEARKKQFSKGGFCTILSQNGILGVSLIFSCLTAPAAIGLGLVEILSNERIGVDWLPTILFLVWRTTFYLCNSVFQPYVLSTIVGRMGTEAKNAVSDYKKNTRILIAFTNIIGFIVLATIFVRNEIGQVITFVVYSVLVAITLTGFFLQSRHTRNKVVAILDKSYQNVKNEQILDVRRKLVRFQNSVMMQSAFMAILSLLYACVPYFWNKFSYLVAVNVIFPGILYLNVIRAITSDSNKKGSGESSANLRGTQARKGTLPAGKPQQKITKDLKLEALEETVGSGQYNSDGGVLEGTQVPYVHGLEVSIANLSAIASPGAKVEDKSQVEHKTYLPSPKRMMAKLSEMTTPSKRGLGSSRKGFEEQKGIEGDSGAGLDVISSATSMTGIETHIVSSGADHGTEHGTDHGPDNGAASI